MELQCYSRLNLLLASQDLTVPELHRKLAARGIRANIKSLYRLNDPLAAIEKIDTKIAGQICHLLRVDLSALFGFRERLDLTRLNPFPPRAQKKLDDLLDKNREGRLSEEQEKELAQLIEAAEILMLANARALAVQRRSLAKTSFRRQAKSKRGK